MRSCSFGSCSIRGFGQSCSLLKLLLLQILLLLILLLLKLLLLLLPLNLLLIRMTGYTF